jgi:hypothetical protein
VTPGTRHLQDMVFDTETKVALHTEMAKKNLFVKRGEILSTCHSHVLSAVALIAYNINGISNLIEFVVALLVQCCWDYLHW